LRFRFNSSAISSIVIIVTALSREAIEDVFLEKIDPLDQVISRATRGRDNITDRNFYRDLLKERQRLRL
jgi:hypothetical protein